jgi:hypothetical protein
MPKKEIYFEFGDYMVNVKKVPDQSGLRNVIQHTYYLKEDINNDRFPKKNDIQL